MNADDFEPIITFGKKALVCFNNLPKIKKIGLCLLVLFLGYRLLPDSYGPNGLPKCDSRDALSNLKEIIEDAPHADLRVKDILDVKTSPLTNEHQTRCYYRVSTNGGAFHYIGSFTFREGGGWEFSVRKEGYQ